MKQRLYFLFILLKCLVHFLRRGKADKLNVAPRSILVVQLAWLGDMVCTTPVFSAIKRKFPDCRVIVLGAKRNEHVLAHHPDVDRYIIWDEKFETLRGQIVSEPIEYACMATPHFLSLAYLYLLDIPAIAVPKILHGYSPLETISFRLLRPVAISVPHSMGMYAPREYLRLLEPVGIFSDDTSKSLYFSAEAERTVARFIEGNSDDMKKIKVVISPSTGNKIKNWPAERFAQVADQLMLNNHHIFLIGSKGDQREVEAVIAASQYPEQITNALNQFSLDELKAFISKMDLFISCDTGPLYIAEAFGVPTVDIIGPVDEREQPPPQGPTSRWVIASERSGPVMHVMNSRIYDPVLAHKAVHGITPSMVLDAVRILQPAIRERMYSHENTHSF